MKDLIIFILCLLIFVGVVCYVVTNHSARIQTPNLTSIITPTVQAPLQLKGHYIDGYKWEGANGDSTKLMFDSLWSHGWRFYAVDKSEYASAYARWLNRINVRYPSIIKDGKLTVDKIIDFSIVENEKIPEFWKDWIEMDAVVTYYSWTEKNERIWKGRTSLNRSAKNDDGVAVDPRIIPYGSLVSIPGVGVRIADDTGSKCKEYGKRGRVLVDVRVVGMTDKEISRLGKKKMKIRVKIR